MAKKKAAVSDVLDMPCSFGGVSFGKKTVRVGVTVARECMTLSKADAALCDRRLMLTIHANGNGDQEGQGRLEGMEDELDITSSADVKGFGVHTESLTFGLTFNKNELRSIAAGCGYSLDSFAGREGRLIIAGISAIPEEEKTAAENGDGDDAE